MEIRATVIGVTLPTRHVAATFPNGGARKMGARTWVRLPWNTGEKQIDAIAKKLKAKLVVIEVEVETGTRCEDLSAWTYEAPGRKRERDLTDEANEIFAGWEMDGALDEEEAALAIAWTLAEADRDTRPPS